MTQCRLFLYHRYTKHIISDVSREQIQITLSIFLMTWVMSFFTQFVENIYNYDHENWDLIDYYHNWMFFMMTTLSTVGYGSSI